MLGFFLLSKISLVSFLLLACGMVTVADWKEAQMNTGEIGRAKQIFFFPIYKS